MPKLTEEQKLEYAIGPKEARGKLFKELDATREEAISMKEALALGFGRHWRIAALHIVGTVFHISWLVAIWLIIPLCHIVNSITRLRNSRAFRIWQWRS